MTIQRCVCRLIGEGAKSDGWFMQQLPQTKKFHTGKHLKNREI